MDTPCLALKAKDCESERGTGAPALAGAAVVTEGQEALRSIACTFLLWYQHDGVFLVALVSRILGEGGRHCHVKLQHLKPTLLVCLIVGQEVKEVKLIVSFTGCVNSSIYGIKFWCSCHRLLQSILQGHNQLR